MGNFTKTRGAKWYTTSTWLDTTITPIPSARYAKTSNSHHVERIAWIKVQRGADDSLVNIFPGLGAGYKNCSSETILEYLRMFSYELCGSIQFQDSLSEDIKIKSIFQGSTLLSSCGLQPCSNLDPTQNVLHGCFNRVSKSTLCKWKIANGNIGY